MADQITPPSPSSSPPPSAPVVAPPTPPSALWSLILGILSFVCCGFLAAIPAEARGRIEHRLADTNEVVSADGNARVRVPGNWSKLKNLNDAAEIQAGNKRKEQYILVLSENKSDLSAMTLRKHHQITHDAMLKKMTNASASEPVELTINGQAALQDEISGTQNRTNIVFLHTTVEGDKHFHQILAWTSKSRWDEHKEKLREVTGTFRSED